MTCHVECMTEQCYIYDTSYFDRYAVCVFPLELNCIIFLLAIG
jgi:hypothetical protein